MNLSTLESKTIRPGSLGTYSYYHSNRRPAAPPRPAYISASRLKLIPKSRGLLIAAAVIALIAVPMFMSIKQSTGKQPVSAQSAGPGPQKVVPAAVGGQSSQTAGRCAGNTLDKLILVSVTQRHLWACEGAKTVRESAVITGLLAHDATMTPTGTYKIYGKTTDTTLTGADATGTWNDPVYYWMPFFDNQHGTYGFHDATWRPDSAFGKVDPNSSGASHGCIELPLGASKWLYNWAPIGTTVTVEQ